MRAADWKDYELLDTSAGERLERWGDVILARPDPQVIWNTPKGEDWKRANAHYRRSTSGGGHWEVKNMPREQWVIHYKELSFKISPTGFKHTGLFPEQAHDGVFRGRVLRVEPRHCGTFFLVGSFRAGAPCGRGRPWGWFARPQRPLRRGRRKGVSVVRRWRGGIRRAFRASRSG